MHDNDNPKDDGAMRSTEPDVILSGRYSQAQAARALDVDRHTVSRYEKLGMISFRMRSAMGRKVTTGAEIVKLWKRLN